MGDIKQMNSSSLYTDVSKEKIYTDFLSELFASSEGKKTSLRWIINPLPPSVHLRNEEVIQVLVIGGSVCKSALVKIIHHVPKILSEKNILKPPFPTKESFLEFVASNINDEIETVVINAADTMEPILENGKMDGIFLVPTKENKMTGLLGKKLGEEITNYTLKRYKRDVSIHIANDTVCLLLSGLTKFHWQNLIGGIVGTGLNIAIFLDSKHIVNLESGGYTKILQSEPGKYIDQHSDEKGEYLFEKETAGGYLYKHFNFWIEQKKISYPQISNTAQLSHIASGNPSEVSEIAKEILRYSATLFACQVAAVSRYLKMDIYCIMQGSLFWEGYTYQETCKEIVTQLVPEHSVSFEKIENADILGASELLCGM